MPTWHDAEVDCNRCYSAGGERNNLDDDRGLCRQFGLDFKGKFHAPKRWPVPGKEEELEEGGGEGARMKARNPGTVSMTEVTAPARPWFLVRAQKPTGEEVSSKILLPVYYYESGHN